MLKQKERSTTESRMTNANMTIDEIMPKGLALDQFAGLDDDDILMQNVIGGGIDQKSKKETVEQLLIDD